MGVMGDGWGGWTKKKNIHIYMYMHMCSPVATRNCNNSCNLFDKCRFVDKNCTLVVTIWVCFVVSRLQTHCTYASMHVGETSKYQLSK